MKTAVMGIDTINDFAIEIFKDERAPMIVSNVRQDEEERVELSGEKYASFPLCH